jgi:hypothetical protein
LLNRLYFYVGDAGVPQLIDGPIDCLGTRRKAGHSSPQLSGANLVRRSTCSRKRDNRFDILLNRSALQCRISRYAGRKVHGSRSAITDNDRGL